VEPQQVGEQVGRVMDALVAELFEMGEQKSCIGAGAVLTNTLHQVGFPKAYPMTVRVMIFNPKATQQLASAGWKMDVWAGKSVEEFASGCNREKPAPPARQGWLGVGGCAWLRAARKTRHSVEAQGNRQPPHPRILLYKYPFVQGHPRSERSGARGGDSGRVVTWQVAPRIVCVRAVAQPTAAIASTSDLPNELASRFWVAGH
jgi:hypothetical protein